MTYRTVVGLDPSLTATGIAGLMRDDRSAWRLVYRHHVGAPKPGDGVAFVDRLDALERDVREALIAALVGRAEPTLLVAEDPTDYRAPRAGGPSQRAKFGAGIGVVLLTAKRAAAEFGIRFETYGTQEWLPTQGGKRGGGWRYKMPHKAVLQQTQRLVPGTVGATDDETMAAALAFWRICREGLAR